MNGRHHRSLSRAALSLLGVEEYAKEPMVKASCAPDLIRDVLVRAPGGEFEEHLLGRELASFLHFQLPGGRGYCWQDDPSLSVAEEIGEVAMRVTSMTVMGTSVPMLRACDEQPGVALCDFRFPSAARVGGFYAAASQGKRLEWMGYALHFVQDCCVPHHARGALLWGHVGWEDGAESLWLDHVARLMLDPSVIPDTLGRACAAEDCGQGSIEELCEANAEWARRWFGAPGKLEECTGDAALAVSVRAVASSMAAINLMTRGAT